MTDLERKVFRLSAIVGSALTLGVLICDGMGWLGGLEKWLYDRRVADCQYFRKPPSDRIVHVDIDDRSVESIGKWPWSRDKVGAILEELARAGPKVIGTDIVYIDPAEIVGRRQADQSFKEIDEDKEMAQSLHRAGNVVIPLSLKPAESHSLTKIETALQAELTANLELKPEQLASRLKVLGYSSEAVSKAIADQYFPARRQAMYDRILTETATGPLKLDELLPRLLPDEARQIQESNGNVHSPLTRLLEDENQQVLSWHEVERFAIPRQPDSPPPLETTPNGIPLQSFAHEALGCGFADDSLTEPVVRNMPMFVQCQGKTFAQWGLVFACKLIDADLNQAHVTAGQVRIPSPTGELVIPLRAQYSAPIGKTVPLIVNIPWFGNSDWQTMYDWPKHESAANHLPINQIWDICETVARIKINNATIDKAIFDLLDDPGEQFRLAMDSSAAAKYRAALPPDDEPLAREKMVAATMKIVGEFPFLDSYNAIKPADRKPEDIAAYEIYTDAPKAMNAAMAQNRELNSQLLTMRAALAKSVRDKGVLIGWTATGAVDMVTTPLHARCPGVVVHGAIANAVVTGQWWRTAPFWVTGLLTVFLGVFIALATGWLSPHAGVVTAIATAIIYFLINGVLLFDWGHWIVGAAGPLVAIALTWAGCLVTRIITEGIDRIHRERDLAVFRHEMSLAKNVQVALIPKEMPTIDGIEPFGWTKPADETGGDLFDLWTLPDGRLGILVADASGHGLAPSVIVSQVRTLVRALSEIENHPNGLLARVNARLAQDLEPARFVTAFLGFLDSTGTLHWASAGHGPMLWCTKDGEEFQSLDATALPLGIMPDYMGDEIGPLQLDITGMLVVTSDGIFEAPASNGDQFGIERVVETLKNYAGKSPLEITGAIRDAVTKWQTNPDKPADDQTTVIIRRVAAGLNVTVIEDKSAVVEPEPAK
jgi:CHASE2 domain-containing sensor protein